MSGCALVYVCVYLRVYGCVCISLSVYMFVGMGGFVLAVCVCARMCICVCLCDCECIYDNMCGCLSVFVYDCAKGWIMYVRVFVCMFKMTS